MPRRHRYEPLNICFLYPGGRYRMTPLYDVISAQPSVDAGQIRQNSFRLAMAVGDNRHS